MLAPQRQRSSAMTTGNLFKACVSRLLVRTAPKKSTRRHLDEADDDDSHTAAEPSFSLSVAVEEPYEEMEAYDPYLDSTSSTDEEYYANYARYR